ncbi:glycoside hydrolase family 3 C-terminal domain-containing protein [Priestia aryabhattai]|uniref:glycoside hydrolase family 3 C-terminal domain-containing protein n=1 Tax=Priestia aryabhattai TaxID=412384 RepID=UPI0032E88CEF
MKSQYKVYWRQFWCVLLVVCMISTTFTLFYKPKVSLASKEEAYIPKRDSNGRPIFDGNPEHLKEFVNYMMDHDMDKEDLIALADPRQPEYKKKGEISNEITVKAGYKLPLFLDGTDNVQGIYTDFPAFIGIGNSWNSQLANKIGNVIGNEKRGTVSIDDNKSMLVWSAIGDIRDNPLSGRYEEGFAEDPYLTTTLTDKLASGLSGVNVNDENPNNDFYLKAALQSKHYANYNAQWFRMSGNFNVSTRAMHEYQLPSFLKQAQNGSVIGFMTSYGRTNGVPNGISPTINIAKNISPYSLFLLTDYGAPINMVEGFGNGFDKSYVPNNEYMSALYAKIGSSKAIFNYEGSPGYPSKDQTASGLRKGLLGVDLQTLKNAVRPVLEMWVRLGYFNERDSEGYAVGYPYNNLMKNKQDAKTKENQEIALQSARESIVLLKNKNTLPLKDDSHVAVIGQFAEIRNKGVYAVKDTPVLDKSGLTAAEGIKDRIGSQKVSTESGGKVIAWKSLTNNKFLTINKDGSSVDKLVAKSTPNSQSSKEYTYRLPHSSDYLTKNEAFEVYDWGQDAYSFQSLANNKFLNRDKTDVSINGDRPSTSNSSVFSYETVTDDKHKSLRQGSITGSFLGGFETSYLTSGNYLTTEDNGLVTGATTVKDYKNSNDKNKNTYEEVTLKEPGLVADDTVKSNDYAVIVVGAPAKINAGEGADRARLELGKDQVSMIKNAAAKFAKHNKKAIVVINTNFPVAMEEIQNDPNVNAIVFAPYGGQYDGKALAEVLFGDYAPTGRLNGTWYKDSSSFPKINEYNVPEGSSMSLSDLDPRYKIDMDNADPLETKLTYMHTSEKPTYAFGYGLSYSKFKYSNLQVPSKVDSNTIFKVKVDVKNTGKVNTSEVVQLYSKNSSSKYGKYIPKKKLIGFSKVNIPPGQTKTVSIDVDPKDLAIWDVNNQKNIIESGKYTFMVGKSSEDIQMKKNIKVKGDELGVLNLDEASNVWDHAFSSSDLVYREVSKDRTINYKGGYYAVMSTGSDSWVGLSNVKMAGSTGVNLRVASSNDLSSIEVRKGSPNGERLATLNFKGTGETAYKIPGANQEGDLFKELGYRDIKVKFSHKVQGINDLYLVFNKKDIRVDSIKLIK